MSTSTRDTPPEYEEVLSVKAIQIIVWSSALIGLVAGALAPLVKVGDVSSRSMSEIVVINALLNGAIFLGVGAVVSGLIWAVRKPAVDRRNLVVLERRREIERRKTRERAAAAPARSVLPAVTSSSAMSLPYRAVTPQVPSQLPVAEPPASPQHFRAGAPVANGVEDVLVSRLRRLDALHAAGVITDEERTEQRRKVLSEI